MLIKPERGEQGPAETVQSASAQESDSNWGSILRRLQTKAVPAARTELISQVLCAVFTQITVHACEKCGIPGRLSQNLHV